MLEEVTQVILRNRGSSGYETIYSSTDVEIETELLPYILPRSKTTPNYPNYYFKYPINQDSTLVKLVQDDGVDQYNRFKAKVILFIIPNDIYEKINGLLFFASPIWLQTISLDDNSPLDFHKDFDVTNSAQLDVIKKVNTSFLAFILDKLLLYDNFLIVLDKKGTLEADRIFMMKILAYLDSKLPSFLRNQISIKSLANKNYSQANCTILQEYDKNLDLNEKSYVYSFTNKILNKEFNFPASNLAKKILTSKSQEELSVISRTLFNQKAVLRENLITTEEYSLLASRFNIKDSKILSRFFKNFNLR
jgi:hypothetical protein